MSVIIKNPKSGLVLDASEVEVKLQKFTGFPAQRWTWESIAGGKFLIVNQGNGKVLDIKGGVNKNAKLITFQKHETANQQWIFNTDSTIVSGGGNLVVDIHGGKLVAGNPIIAHPKHGEPNQLFIFELL